MEINDFYSALMSDLLIEDVTDDGRMSIIYDPEKPQPLNIGGKRLTFPLKDVLKAGKKDDQIIFHPLSENITRGESDVIKSLRDLIQWRVQSIAQILLDQMGRVAASPSEHKGLGPKASKYLQLIPDMDEKTYAALSKLLKRVSPDPTRRLISITMRQGSKSKDDGVLRSVSVHFPPFEDFARDDLEVFEMSMPSKKAKARLAKLFEIVFGDEETRKSFSYGSSNMEAPYFHALLTVFNRLGEHFNNLVTTHAKLLGTELAAEMMLKLDWVPAMEDFAHLRAVVPPQVGNEGAVKVDVDKVREKAKAKAKEVERSKPPRLAPPTERGTLAEGETPPWDDDAGEILTPTRSREREREVPREREREYVRPSSREPEAPAHVGLGDFMSKLRGDAPRASSRENRLGYRDERETSGRSRSGGGFRPSRNRSRSF